MPENAAAAFKPTRWSLVLQARGDDAHAKQAIEELCSTYWFPLYAWCRRSGISQEDAEDHVQSFFVQVLQKELFAIADPTLGKLRTFLLTAFRRHVQDEQRKEARQKRGGGRVISFDGAEAEAWYEVEQVEGETAEHMFDRQWALTVLQRALTQLEQHAATRGKSVEFAELRTFLTQDGSGPDYEATGRKLGMNANAVKVAIHRLRSRFREALRAEVAETQRDPAGVEEEMSYLLQVLRGA